MVGATGGPSSKTRVDDPRTVKAEALSSRSDGPKQLRGRSTTHAREFPWVVSYDGDPRVLALYARRRSFLYSLQYSAIRRYKGAEVFIFSDDLKLPNESRVPAVHDALAGLRAIDNLEEVSITEI